MRMCRCGSLKRGRLSGACSGHFSYCGSMNICDAGGSGRGRLSVGLSEHFS